MSQTACTPPPDDAEAPSSSAAWGRVTQDLDQYRAHKKAAKAYLEQFHSFVLRRIDGDVPWADRNSQYASFLEKLLSSIQTCEAIARYRARLKACLVESERETPVLSSIEHPDRPMHHQVALVGLPEDGVAAAIPEEIMPPLSFETESATPAARATSIESVASPATAAPATSVESAEAAAPVAPAALAATAPSTMAERVLTGQQDQPARDVEMTIESDNTTNSSGNERPPDLLESVNVDSLSGSEKSRLHTELTTQLNDLNTARRRCFSYEESIPLFGDRPAIWHRGKVSILVCPVHPDLYMDRTQGPLHLKEKHSTNEFQFKTARSFANIPTLDHTLQGFGIEITDHPEPNPKMTARSRNTLAGKRRATEPYPGAGQPQEAQTTRPATRKKARTSVAQQSVQSGESSRAAAPAQASATNPAATSESGGQETGFYRQLSNRTFATSAHPDIPTDGATRRQSKHRSRPSGASLFTRNTTSNISESTAASGKTPLPKLDKFLSERQKQAAEKRRREEGELRTASTSGSVNNPVEIQDSTETQNEFDGLPGADAIDIYTADQTSPVTTAREPITPTSGRRNIRYSPGTTTPGHGVRGLRVSPHITRPRQTPSAVASSAVSRESVIPELPDTHGEYLGFSTSQICRIVDDRYRLREPPRGSVSGSTDTQQTASPPPSPRSPTLGRELGEPAEIQGRVNRNFAIRRCSCGEGFDLQVNLERHKRQCTGQRSNI